jgi:hypothetical protein
VDLNTVRWPLCRKSAGDRPVGRGIQLVAPGEGENCLINRQANDDASVARSNTARTIAQCRYRAPLIYPLSAGIAAHDARIRLQAASHKGHRCWCLWEAACTRASIGKTENLSPESSVLYAHYCWFLWGLACKRGSRDRFEYRALVVLPSSETGGWFAGPLFKGAGKVGRVAIAQSRGDVLNADIAASQ